MIGGIRSRIPSASELRATALAARWRVRSDGLVRRARERASAPDETLLDLVADPFESVDDAATRLRAAERHLRGRSDRRSVFLTVYAEMTAAVAAGLDAGQFEDPDWVRTYTVAFANRYRRALVDFEQGDDLPGPWAIGFGASTNGATVLLQDALLGINAHINYDLPYTLRDVAIDPDRPAKRRDHRRVNDVLRQLIDVVQRSLAAVYGAEGYRALDRGLGDLDEQLTIVGLREARELAWLNAARLVDARWTWVRRLVRWRIRLVATGAAAFILAPSADPRALRRLQDLEREGPPFETLLERFEADVAAATIDIE